MTQVTVHKAAEGEQNARFQLLLGGRWVAGAGDRVPVLDKYRLESFAEVTYADKAQADEMIKAASMAFEAGVPVAYERGEVLDRAARLVAGRKGDFISIMQREAGFTASDAGGEVERCVQTLRLSAEEARRLAGDIVPFEGAPGQRGRLAFTFRVPLGVIVAITPFNSPLNTVAHKIAPAFAAGNAVILKPATSTPGTACLLAEILLEAGMPDGFLSLLHAGGDVVQHLLADDRVRFFAFTGSTQVGRKIQQIAGLRRTQMELGSIAFTILCDDADQDRALPKIVNAGYRKAGQVCTSVQMLLVQSGIVDQVTARLIKLVSDIRYGDPRNPDVLVGPVISEEEAIRIEDWIDQAISKGAKLLVGGKREGAVVPPTLLAGITGDMNVSCAEIFGPVVAIVPFRTFDEAIARVNATPFGLASGIFTNRIDAAFAAARNLRVGGVHINETSSARVDMMPYGGSKDSGFGREGPHYAVREMTEERIISITTG